MRALAVDIDKEKSEISSWRVFDSASVESGQGLNRLLEYLSHTSDVFYTYNLSHLGAMIVDALLRADFQFVEEKALKPHQFNALITTSKDFYNIKICFSRGHKRGQSISVEIRDAAAKVPGGVEALREAYGTPTDPEEIVVYKAIKYQLESGYKRLTASSDALDHYKKLVGGNRNYRAIFPLVTPEEDLYFKRSYYGGLCMIAPGIKGKTIEDKISVYDINSAYPFQMATQYIPTGRPKYYKGKYVPSESHPLYIARINVCCKLKEGHIPTLFEKRNFTHLYITDTGGQLIEKYLTSIDLALLFENYNVYDIEYLDGYAFRASHNLFKQYVEPLYELKSSAKGAARDLSKRLLNGLYGKLGARTVYQRYIPQLIEGALKYIPSGVEHIEPQYTPAAAFITAYQRRYLSEAINENYERFLYCDTDSMHMRGEEPPKMLYISNNELGAFKLEEVAHRARYLAPKFYFLEGEQAKIAAAGIPNEIAAKISFNEFNYITKVNILQPARTDAGIVYKNISRPLAHK